MGTQNQDQGKDQGKQAGDNRSNQQQGANNPGTRQPGQDQAPNRQQGGGQGSNRQQESQGDRQKDRVTKEDDTDASNDDARAPGGNQQRNDTQRLRNPQGLREEERAGATLARFFWAPELPVRRPCSTSAAAEPATLRTLRVAEVSACAQSAGSLLY